MSRGTRIAVTKNKDSNRITIKCSRGSFTAGEFITVNLSDIDELIDRLQEVKKAEGPRSTLPSNNLCREALLDEPLKECSPDTRNLELEDVHVAIVQDDGLYNDWLKGK